MKLQSVAGGGVKRACAVAFSTASQLKLLLKIDIVQSSVFNNYSPKAK